jgi:hypothetical protein
LARGISGVRSFAVDVALDIVELSDPVERLAGDLGLG